MIKIFKNGFKFYHRPSAKILHFFVLLQKILFNKQTNIFSERILLLKNPPQSMIYYNSLGRIINLFLNFFSILFFNKFYEKGVEIDIEKNLSNNSKINRGNDNTTWPLQAIHSFDTYNDRINEDFLKKFRRIFSW